MRWALTTLTTRVAPVAAIVSSTRRMEQIAIVLGGVVIVRDVGFRSLWSGWLMAAFVAVGNANYSHVEGLGTCKGVLAVYQG